MNYNFGGCQIDAKGLESAGSLNIISKVVSATLTNELIKKEVLDIIMPLALIKRHAFDLELCFLAQKHGFRTVEAPINIKYKFSGTSISRKTVLGMFLDTLAIRYRYSILHYYQKIYHKSRFQE